jgi:hypothetical protein
MVNVGIFYDHLEYFMAIWHNLWPLGIVCGHLWYFSQFGMFGSRKIWQPWFWSRTRESWRKSWERRSHFLRGKQIKNCEVTHEQKFEESTRSKLRGKLLFMSRLTRLGEFSPIWAIVFYGFFFENDKISPTCWAFYFHRKFFILIFGKKLIELNFCRFFSLTHLVTLFMRTEKSRKMEYGKSNKERKKISMVRDHRHLWLIRIHMCANLNRIFCFQSNNTSKPELYLFRVQTFICFA